MCTCTQLYMCHGYGSVGTPVAHDGNWLQGPKNTPKITKLGINKNAIDCSIKKLEKT